MKKILVAAALASAIFTPMAAQAAKTAVNYSMRLEPPGLDPRTGAAAAISRIALYNIFEGLTRIGADGTVKPSLAKSWTISPDGLVTTYPNEMVKFQEPIEVTFASPTELFEKENQIAEKRLNLFELKEDLLKQKNKT